MDFERLHPRLPLPTTRLSGLSSLRHFFFFFLSSTRIFLILFCQRLSTSRMWTGTESLSEDSHARYCHSETLGKQREREFLKSRDGTQTENWYLYTYSYFLSLCPKARTRNDGSRWIGHHKFKKKIEVVGWSTRNLLGWEKKKKLLKFSEWGVGAISDKSRRKMLTGKIYRAIAPSFDK